MTLLVRYSIARQAANQAARRRLARQQLVGAALQPQCLSTSTSMSYYSRLRRQDHCEEVSKKFCDSHRLASSVFRNNSRLLRHVTDLTTTRYLSSNADVVVEASSIRSRDDSKSNEITTKTNKNSQKKKPVKKQAPVGVAKGELSAVIAGDNPALLGATKKVAAIPDAKGEISAIHTGENVEVNHHAVGTTKKKRKRLTSKKKFSGWCSLNLPVPIHFTSVFSKQTQHNAQHVFISLVSRLEHPKLLMFSNQMSGLAIKIKTNLGNKEKIQKIIESKMMHSELWRLIAWVIRQTINLYKPLSGPTETKTNTLRPTESMPPEVVKNNELQPDYLNWIKALLTDFFSGLNVNATDRVASPTVTGSPLAVWSDLSLKPGPTRAEFEKHVAVLMMAREMCLKVPFLWSNKQTDCWREGTDEPTKNTSTSPNLEKNSNDSSNNDSFDDNQNVASDSITESETTNNLDELNTTKQLLKKKQLNKLQAAHRAKCPAVLKAETEAMESLLADRLPSTIHDKVVEMFDDFANRVDALGPNSSKKAMTKVQRRRMFFPRLKLKANFHVHLIATDLASFFYVDVPDSIKVSNSAAAAAATDATTLRATHNHKMTSSDPRLNKAWQEWNKVMEQMTQNLLTAQHLLSDMGRSVLHGRIGEKAEISSAIMSRINNDEALAKDGVKVETDSAFKSGQDEARAKRSYAIYSAILLNDRFGLCSSPKTALAADTTNGAVDGDLAGFVSETKNMIMIENLPIDTDEVELQMLYSKCGPVESVDIFNLRPDLDPGVLSAKQKKSLIKEQRISGSKMLSGGAPVGSSRHHMRSPVYAMIKFQTTSGYATAISDPLRIFGMIIRRHPVRSINVRDNVRTIYVENIPSGFSSLDVEYRLSTILSPDVYVSLNLSQRRYSKPQSCKVVFPSFEAAYHSFRLLNKSDCWQDQGCVLNWMPTPTDAMKFWTRETSYEY